MKPILTIILIFSLPSCALIPKTKIPTNCLAANEELATRYDLFSKISDDEIKKRQSINVPDVAPLDQFSVVYEIIKSIKSAPQNSQLIPIDLRHYNSVGLGNVIISNVQSDAMFKRFLQESKFAQGFFAIININKKSITIAPPTTQKNLFNNIPQSLQFDKDLLRYAGSPQGEAAVTSPKNKKIYSRSKNLGHIKIDRGDLNGVELVINVSDAGDVFGNMKFSGDQKVSIIADRVKKPYRMDLREASNMQFNLNQQWIMPVYSIEESALVGGKDTTGLFKFVNNKNTREIKLDKFYKSSVECYSDVGGKKFDEE